MSTYTPNPAAGVPTSIPIPDDGTDPRAAIAINPALEGLADGMAALFRRGVRTTATLSTLAAITPKTTGDVVFVPYFGLYRYESGLASGLEDGLFAVRSGDNAGTWYSQYTSLLRDEVGTVWNAENGFAKVTDGKIATRVIPWASLGNVFNQLAGEFTTTSTSFVDAQVEPSIALQTGDKLVIHACGHLFTTDAAKPAEAIVTVRDAFGGGTIYEKSCTFQQTVQTFERDVYSATAWHIVQATGPVDVAVQIRASATGTAKWGNHGHLIIEISRN